jgi:predicted PurR-regulated permease PerM
LTESSRKALVAAAAFGLVLALLLALRVVYPVLLLTFAGLLFAVLLSGLAVALTGTGLSYRWSVACVFAAMLLLAVTGVLLAGPGIAAQVDVLAERLPRALQSVLQRVQHWSWGRALSADASLSPERAKAWAGGAARLMVAAIVNTVFVVFVGLFVALEPRVYRRGLLALVPAAQRERAGEILASIGISLRWWLLGRGFTMVVITVATSLGLWALDIPLAVTLGVLAGLLNFVPYIGPVVAGVPAVLLGLAESVRTGLWVAALFLAIQTLEGYILTPLVDRRSVSVAPALTLVAQMTLGLLVGSAGVVLASPLLVCVLVAIQKLRGSGRAEDAAA